MIHPKVEQFIAFCEHQPEYREYDWDSSTYCALGRFNSFNNQGWEEDFTVCNEIAAQRPRNFGTLAKRLKRAFLEGDETAGMYYRRLHRPMVLREVTVRDLHLGQQVTYCADCYEG